MSPEPQSLKRLTPNADASASADRVPANVDEVVSPGVPVNPIM
jgi:hypothetical protein